MRPLKIDIVVHGRFHAFHLARELIALGHDVVVYTNYPSRVASRFGLPPTRVRSFVRHGLLARIYKHIRQRVGGLNLDAYLHRSFGHWASRQIRADADLVYGFSGVMEESLISSRAGRRHRRVWVVRGSAHIRTQHRLLVEEERRVGILIEKPSKWMIDREEREYALADRIVVLSTFARQSFEHEVVPSSKLIVSPLGVDTKRFAATSEDLERRCSRILSCAPLNSLTVGTFSGQKGAADFVAVARALSGVVRFRFVGDISTEVNELARRAQDLIEFLPRVPEFELPRFYGEADLFTFCTIQDGFAAVLAQAAAAGLPILTTTNCSGFDLVVTGVTGWVLPIRRPDLFEARLRWCDRNRFELSQMVRAIPSSFQPWDWRGMARSLEDAYEADIGRRDFQ